MKQNKVYLFSAIAAIVVLFIGVVAFFFTSPRLFAEIFNISEQQRQQLQAMIDKKDELTAGTQTSMTFYGQVLDQNDDPVPGAEIAVIYNTSSSNPLAYYNKLKTQKLVTDSDGKFTFQGNGRWLYIEYNADYS